MTHPDVIPDQDAIGPSLLEEGMVALRGGRVIFRTIGKSMLRRPVERMVWRADTHLRGDRTKPADLRVADHAARTEIGVVAELRIFQRAVAQNFAAAADRRLPQSHRGVDHRFGKLWARYSLLVHIGRSSSFGQPAAASGRHLSWRAGRRERAFGLVSMRHAQ